MDRRYFLTGLASLAFVPRTFAQSHEVFTPSCILKADRSGKWRVLHDDTHQPYGFHGVTQHDDRLQVHFTGDITGWRSYSKAGVAQVTTDDGLAGTIWPSANLGLDSVTIFLRVFPDIRADDEPIDPADVWKYAPNPANGNLWVTANNMVV